MCCASKNYVFRMFATSSHHPVIFRCRARGSGQFHTRSKRPRSTAAARMLRGSRCGSSASLTVGVLGCAELESSAGGRDRVLRLMSILVKQGSANRRGKNASEPLPGRGVRCAECMYLYVHMLDYDHVCMCARTHAHTHVYYIHVCV